MSMLKDLAIVLLVATPGMIAWHFILKLLEVLGS